MQFLRDSNSEKSILLQWKEHKSEEYSYIFHKVTDVARWNSTDSPYCMSFDLSKYAAYVVEQTWQMSGLREARIGSCEHCAEMCARRAALERIDIAALPIRTTHTSLKTMIPAQLSKTIPVSLSLRFVTRNWPCKPPRGAKPRKLNDTKK